jgi:hypothetical protein
MTGGGDGSATHAREESSRKVVVEAEGNGIRNTHDERVAWSVFRQARHLDYKGLSEKPQK